MPATNAAMAKPASLTFRTLIPAAAAARSFERTASIRWPRLERRVFATSRPSRIVAARTRKPNVGLGILSSTPRNGPPGERSRPPIAGWATGDPWSPPPHLAFRKPNCSSATAAESVTIARLTPRTRRAETATRSPTIVATEAPISSEIGNFAQTPPTSVVRWDIVKPATPASASCTTEIWPTKPMMTTRERQMTMPSSELISACLKSYGNTISAMTPRIAAIVAGLQQPLGPGNGGQPPLDDLAASGQARPSYEQGEDDDEEDEELREAPERGPS